MHWTHLIALSHKLMYYIHILCYSFVPTTCIQFNVSWLDPTYPGSHRHTSLTDVLWAVNWQLVDAIGRQWHGTWGSSLKPTDSTLSEPGWWKNCPICEAVSELLLSCMSVEYIIILDCCEVLIGAESNNTVFETVYTMAIFPSLPSLLKMCTL